MIRDNILNIKERIAQACSQVGRDPRQITVVAVTKGRNIDEIRQAIAAGISDIGENKVQEALLKYSELATNRRTHEPANLRTIRWHMVGHLQTNKVKEALKIFDLIHSVDSLRLGREINKQSQRLNKVQDILIEVKTSEEATKFGFKPEEAAEAVRELTQLKNINVTGLMTIAPRVDNPEEARPYFRALREMKDQINQLTSHPLTILSMGMSDDFEAAIEEGASLVRLGRAIFEGVE
ncbi:MAG: YggS family pyridoxal phosphate-dependent enzyme [Candidatus Omnitrophica bacterium]|nr:YggS family pyridoxal phosphate-dependent enzyme [Candidatus Omnitrophota bacterium]